MCIATASAEKFEEAVLGAGLTPQPSDSIKWLDTKPTKYEEMKRGEDWEEMLREKIQSITAMRES